MSSSSATTGSFRMREKEFPQVNEFVIVKVNIVTNIDAKVELLEYNYKPAMILLSDYSRKRVRSVNRVIRKGKIEVLQVLNVDERKGYIDLTKKDVKREDEKKCKEKYRKSKIVYNIFSQISKTQNYPIEDLYIHFGFQFGKIYGGSIFKGFQNLIEDSSLIETYNIPNHIKLALLKEIQHQFKQEQKRCEMIIEVSCFTSEGIIAIKRVLKNAIHYFKQKYNQTLRIELVKSPNYRISMLSFQSDIAKIYIKDVSEYIRNEITKCGGNYEIVDDCYIVGEQKSKDSFLESESETESHTESESELDSE